MEFYLKLIMTIVITIVIYSYMAYIQNQKEEKAERVFQRTLKEIEDRNKKI